MPSTDAAISALLDRRSEAIWNRDLEWLLSFYASDVVYFDIVAPLQYVGAAALRERFTHWFDGFAGPIGQEIHDLRVSESGDLAVAHMLILAGGTLRSGQEVGFWVRATDGFQRSHAGWLIAHEHVSLPVDLQTGSAATDLVP